MSEKINAEELIKITSTRNFPSFKKLVTALGYFLADSSELNEDLSYITLEPRAEGNILGVSLTKDLTITMLSFSTYDNALYNKLKKQIQQGRFVSRGLNRKPDNQESEDFEKGNIYISTVAVIKEGRPLVYEFIFLN